MRALVVYCHPSPQSYTAAVCDRIVEKLDEGGAEVRILDLYGRAFQPVLTRDEWETHTDTAVNVEKVADDVAQLQWCNALIFVYPTWWYGPPAMLKGWLEKVMLAGVAFHMPAEGEANIRRGLDNVRTLAVFTTCGATWFLSQLIGQPGRKILLRGLRILCHLRARTSYVAFYDMNHASPQRLKNHLSRVGAKTLSIVAQASVSDLPP